MNLGLCLRYQGREDEAYDAFFKATWTAAEQETSYYHIAASTASGETMPWPWNMWSAAWCAMDTI